VSDAILRALEAVTAVEWIAVVLALGYLWLAIRQDPWCWAFSIASSLLFLVVFARAGLVMQAALQVFFVAMSIYGWRTWRGGATAEPAPVGTWPLRRHALAIAAVAACTVINGALLDAQGRAAWIGYLDAAIAWGSVLTTWLVARKLLENWLYWIAIDVAAATLYATQALHATVVLYLVYALLAVRGYFAWRQSAPAVTHA
jgi:nicotinamide mononucleotide transporter